MREETVVLHGHGYEPVYGEVVPPVYLSVVYEQPGVTRTSDRGVDLKYGREENPGLRVLERILARLEYGEDSVAVNSGMAAIAVVAHWLLGRGDTVLLPVEAYGSTIELFERLSRFGVKVVKAWPDTDSLVEAVLEHRPRMVFVETVTNPTLRVIDVGRVAEACREVGSVLVVDNTFATPLLVNPLRLGARLVLHSLTKYIAGHNDVVGGVVVGSAGDVRELWEWRRLLGTILQPLEAYLVLRGLKTLHVRFERVSRTALAIAEFLEDHPRVENVYYPGLPSNPYHEVARRLFKRSLYGGVVSFTVPGGLEEVRRIVSRLRVIKPTPSLGATETLATIPSISAARYIDPETRRRLGITDGMIRLSVGLEDPDDLIEDLDNALRGATAPRTQPQPLHASLEASTG